MDSLGENQFPGLGEQNVLRHLLDLEAKAAALVEDAQTEVNRRFAEAERQNRALYEERYSQEAVQIEAEYEKKLAVVKEQCKKELDSYRKNLKSLPINKSQFFELLKSLLIKG
jgi:vacuolar-type H+-ATPase subunit H